jgi:hypothetical protein
MIIIIFLKKQQQYQTNYFDDLRLFLETEDVREARDASLADLTRVFGVFKLRFGTSNIDDSLAIV